MTYENDTKLMRLFEKSRKKLRPGLWRMRSEGKHCPQQIKPPLTASLKCNMGTWELRFKINKMEEAMNDECIIGVITRPKRWPSFKFLSSEILEPWMGIDKEDKNINRGLITLSKVNQKWRTQSYVANDAPHWLQKGLDDEKVSPSTRSSC
ncbi:LOW QUALITY PROTEIN: hypothetical protein HID58_037962 [Brassica napus]|uniref:Uncharacterized protein n=1 Tax=Brassica napus TaxID=3708 RepID=A0ABQ8BMV2_BRANA|nr:LOW QUALITY PROTEIN: hypothetical protein HID58_037962 [Brassica napus]